MLLAYAGGALPVALLWRPTDRPARDPATWSRWPASSTLRDPFARVYLSIFAEGFRWGPVTCRRLRGRALRLNQFAVGPDRALRRWHHGGRRAHGSLRDALRGGSPLGRAAMGLAL
jgi:hypothetical protein